MRRSIVVLAMAVVFVLAMASAALAHPKAGFGQGVQYHCGAPYGQLVKQAVQDGPHGGPFVGAKAFITNIAVAEAHGCVFPAFPD